MNLWQEVVTELAAHNIVMNDQGLTLHNRTGQRQFATPEELQQHLTSHADQNAVFLMKLWREVVTLADHRGQFKPNEGIQRMYVDALRHLAKLATESKVLTSVGAGRALTRMLREDVHAYSQDTMSRFVDFRLAIDWVIHLIGYDKYRASLLMALAHKERLLGDNIKTAWALERDYSYSLSDDYRGAPWNLYELQHPGDSRDENPMTTDKTLENQQRDLRHTDPHADFGGDPNASASGRSWKDDDYKKGVDDLLPSKWLRTEEEPSLHPNGWDSFALEEERDRPELLNNISEDGRNGPPSMRTWPDSAG